MHLHRWGTPVCVAAIVASAAIWSSAQGPAAGGQGAPAGAPGSVQGTPAQDTVKGAALLAEARKALGGEDRFKAVQRLEAKGKSVRAQAQTNLEGDFEYLFELPDKFRRNESISLGNAGIDLTQILSPDDVFEEASFAGGGGGIGGFDGGDGGDFGGRGGRGGRGGGRMGNIAGLLGGTAAAGGDPEAQKDAQRRAIGSEMARLMAAILLTSSEPVAWIGVAESPDGKADVLEFRAPDGVPTRLLIDASTHMPLMLTWAGTPAAADFGGRGGRFGNRGGGQAAPDAARGQGGEPGQAQGRRGGRGGGQVPMQMYVSDYKTVNGIRLPHLIQRGANGETTEEFVVRSYRINPSFKADTFKK